MDDRPGVTVAHLVIEPHAPTHDEVGFHPTECERVAIAIGLTSCLIGALTLGYVRHADHALPLPVVWAGAHVAAGLAAMIAMRWRVQGYATAGALIAGLAIMRGIVVLSVGPTVVAGEWRQITGGVLWFAWGGSVWWIWSRVVARHVAWNRARALHQ
jgi:hypothetical protein